MNKDKASSQRPGVREVLFDRIQTDEMTFQPRKGGLNESHVAALLDVLKQGQTLDPIAVWENPESKELTVADGHHRLEAYKRHAKFNAIPTLIFSCPLNDALLIPIKENAKARLALTHDEKANWAWRLTVCGGHSKAAVVAHCGVSDGTVAQMRRINRKLLERGEDIPETWFAARSEPRRICWRPST